MTKRTTTPAPQYNPSAPRSSKREQLRQERKRRNLTWNIIILGIAVVFLGAIAFAFYSTQRPGVLPGEQLIADEGAPVYPDGQALTHGHYPPSSGARYEDAAAWGLTTTAVDPGNYITNLYHGGVVFLYDCDTPCPELEQEFTDLLKNATPETTYNEVKILISPVPADQNLPTQIVALAWNHELDLAAFDRGTLLNWYKRFVNLGPGNAP